MGQGCNLFCKKTNGHLNLIYIREQMFPRSVNSKSNKTFKAMSFHSSMVPLGPIQHPIFFLIKTLDT